MCTFSTVGDAATAAEDMQRSLRQSILNGEVDVKSFAVRVGLHSGPVISHSADIFGGAVPVAKRVTAEAKPGQILIGKETLRWLPNAIAARTRFIGRMEQEPFELFELIWDNDNNNITLGQDKLESKRGHTRAKVRFREATLVVGFDRPAIRMGRGRENEIVVPEPLASRVHARIEWRRDRVFLIDQSLNGTFLQMRGKPEVSLRRDEIALEGTGIISLGKSTTCQEGSCVRFAVLIDG
jgi:hypothetical protein